MLTQTQEPELATALRRMATLSLDIDDAIAIRECRNGSVLISGFRNHKYTDEVHSLLFPERGVVALPQPPRVMTGNGQISTFGLFLSRGVDGCLSYIWLAMEINVSNWVSTGKTFAKVYMLQDGVWVMHTKAMTELPHPLRQPEPLLIGDRIYMAGGTSNDILVLDLANSSFFTIQLPEGVVWPSRHEGGTEFENRDVVFSRADDSGVCLIDLKEFQLHIWLQRMINGCWWIPYVCVRCVLLWGCLMAWLRMSLLMLCG